MIFIDLKDLIGLALLVFCGLVLLVVYLVDRVAYAIEKRQKKKIDEAYREE